MVIPDIGRHRAGSTLAMPSPCAVTVIFWARDPREVRSLAGVSGAIMAMKAFQFTEVMPFFILWRSTFLLKNAYSCAKLPRSRAISIVVVN
jgi:hypothetical protein